ncbi:MAG: hypothetical protein HZB31_08165, partial [Nitrospirae bacterium]|nr:hypothetical protein [Nitrospirota bacterium]
MIKNKIISIDRISDNLLSKLESRDVALWIRSLPKDFRSKEALVAFLGLPWRMVISEVYSPELIEALEEGEISGKPLIRKRGFIRIIDSDPSRIPLPQRCLPIYLLNGRQAAPASSGFADKLRQMTMLEELRRSTVRDILVISADEKPIPVELQDLWSAGFRSYLTFVTNVPDAAVMLQEWLGESDSYLAINLVNMPVIPVVEDILSRYGTTYPEARHVIRIRDVSGGLHKVDITETDEPERPILEHYSLIEERDLIPLMPEELSEEDFIAFFRNPEASWRPFAANLPWIRDMQCRLKLRDCLKKLDTVGAEENCVAYISSESGAGGTTLLRMLAWEFAREGYPVLMAKSVPFEPETLAVVNLLSRVHKTVEMQLSRNAASTAIPDVNQSHEHKREVALRRYETPWLIVFDSLHWQYRDSELIRFRNEMEKSGRPVCIIVVTGPLRSLPYLTSSIFKPLAELNHALDQPEAHELGRHLNQFLRVYGKQRHDWQWDEFYRDHTVRYLEGTSSFWVTLSFWIQGQYDLSESIQQWIYRSFKENAVDRTIQEAILEIAALSSERLPLPEALLPASKGKWPVSYLLEDNKSSLAALGLVRISTNGEKHWALVHDILGRFLINALFYDFKMREDLGFSDAKDAEHLRFLILREVSLKPVLGERAYRSIGEDFATAIFKIDPDHGHGSFVSIWREVLEALDKMPRSLCDTSRVFRHHTAVSRRRIAKLDERIFGVTLDDRETLLNRAIADIEYALNFIDYESGFESNVNLFNSLANAYLDLSEVESEKGAPIERIIELRKLANDVTRKAYAESPTNSFVIETYVKNLLESARHSTGLAIELCIEALGILFSTLISNEAVYRRSQLGSLSEQALSILFKQTPQTLRDVEPANAIDVLVMAWKELTEGSDFASGMALTDVSELNRERALHVLAHPAGRGNMLVIRLSYDLISLNHPYVFRQQLELIEQLNATNYRITPQLRLDYAILLFQCGRPVEGDKQFRSLRQLWRDGEHFVQVAERLRWLRSAEDEALKIVYAVTSSDNVGPTFAKVSDFG